MKQLTICFVMGAITLMLSGCQNPMPRYEREFGESVRNTLQAQIINPEASKNTNPVSGIDGRAARDSINVYQNSFSKPTPQPNIFNFGVGGNGSNSGDGTSQ